MALVPIGNVSLDQMRAAQERIGQQMMGYNSAASEAANRAMGAARTLGGRGNAMLAARQGAEAASRATAPILAQRAAAMASAEQREQDRMRAEYERQQNQARQLMGGLVSGAGQVLGTIMPAFAPAAGAANALGGAIGGQPMGAAIGQAAGAFAHQPPQVQALPTPMRPITVPQAPIQPFAPKLPVAKAVAPAQAEPAAPPAAGAMALGNPAGIDPAEEERRRRMMMGGY